jgi:tetratricopeptide (TPR) repeat protein
MYSQTVAMLEKFDNQHDFERMCADILFALGYRDVELIAPRGGSDGGKDTTFTTESGGKGLACVTLRTDIEKKFFEDFSKRRTGEFEKYIFFCTAYLTALQKLKFAQYAVNTLHAELLSQDIEALRSVLDSVLPSIREQYLGIKDDKRALFESMLATVQDDLQREGRARLLLDKAHETHDLSKAETLVKQAIELMPSVRLEEYLQLGIRHAEIIIDGLPLEISPEYGQTIRVYTKDMLAPHVTSALAYLEETILQAGLPDAEGLLYLACIYGYQKQFNEIITTIDKALAVDAKIQEEFHQPRKLEILLLACGSDRSKIEQVSQKIGIPPVTKETFCTFIRDCDLEGFTGYIKWIAVKRPNTPGEKGVHIINVCPPYVQREGLVCAHSQIYETGQIEGITTSPQFVPVETLYDVLCRSFFLVYPIKRE